MPVPVAYSYRGPLSLIYLYLTVWFTSETFMRSISRYCSSSLFSQTLVSVRQPAHPTSARGVLQHAGVIGLSCPLRRHKSASHRPPVPRLTLISRHSASLAPIYICDCTLDLPKHQTRNYSNMSSQPEHPTLLIPGPIEFDDAVLSSMSHYR